MVTWIHLILSGHNKPYIYIYIYIYLLHTQSSFLLSLLTLAYILYCTTIHPISTTLPSSILLNFTLILLYATLLKQNNPSVILPTFRYTILRSLSTMLPFPTSTTLCYMLYTLLNFATANHPTIIFCHTKLHSLSTFNYTMHAIHYNSVSPSTSIPWPACYYAICCNAQFCLPETLHLLNFYFALSA